MILPDNANEDQDEPVYDEYSLLMKNNEEYDEKKHERKTIGHLKTKPRENRKRRDKD